jgi:uncharacterized protein YbjT (DUF2867 family)
MTSPTIVVTGGTGYIGRRLIPRLLDRGFHVRAIVRAGSEAKVPRGAQVVIGDVRDRASIEAHLLPRCIVVQLVGTPKPSPAKAGEFEALDYVSARECLEAAKAVGVRHFVYVSVAQPAPIMRAYVDVRRRVEEEVVASGVPHTFVRPWYVLGPGHRWPYLFIPMYRLLRALPSTRDGATRLGLVTLQQMLNTLVWTVETAGADSRILNVEDIKRIESAKNKTTA